MKKSIEAKRYIGFNMLQYMQSSKKLGLDHDLNEDIYRGISRMTVNQLAQFAKENVAGRKYRYIILGDVNELDMERLKQIGKVHILSLEEIFGY